jgi:L-threonylcarbamoyladenylate synthase
MGGRIEMIIGDVDAKIGLESTILDLTVAPARILRPGYITAAELAPFVGAGRWQMAPHICHISAHADTGETAPAPGTKYCHYKPKGRLTIVGGRAQAVIDYINEQVANDKGKGLITGVITTEESRPHYRADHVKSLGERDDEAAAAHNLYRVLREFDDEGVAVIYSEAFRGEAVFDRLSRAAEGMIVID